MEKKEKKKGKERKKLETGLCGNADYTLQNYRLRGWLQ